MKRNQPRILFFIVGSTPTVDELEAAEKCGNNVVFRNATLVPNQCNPERCAGVAGNVPEAYKKIPSAEKVLNNFKASEKAKQKAEIERLKRKEEVTAMKKQLASEASAKINAAKQAKVEAGKEVSKARQEAAKVATKAAEVVEAQTIKWQPGK